MEIKEVTLEKIIWDIENFEFLNLEVKSEIQTFELWPDPVLVESLSGNLGALFVRTILNKLNINEHHIFRWRLENKYRQYQILNYYIPGCVAETISFSEVLNADDGAQKIRNLCKSGFFIKATLGDRTGENNNFDRTNELDGIIDSYTREYGHLEKWMIQKRIDLKAEFRIHTFSRDLIYGLTFITNGQDVSKCTAAEDFLRGILEKLPDTILQGTLIGWDIGITNDNEYYVIEANFTGFHPEYARGFQTSGFFGDLEFGPVLCAWLNNYFRIKYHVFIDTVEIKLLLGNQFYNEFIYYNFLIKSQKIEFMSKERGNIAAALIIYLGEVINQRLITLIYYFLMANFAVRYYLIVNGNNTLTVRNPFLNNARINLLIEDTLLDDDELLKINNLSHDEQKEICFRRALHLVRDEPVLCFDLWHHDS